MTVSSKVQKWDQLLCMTCRWPVALKHSFHQHGHSVCDGVSQPHWLFVVLPGECFVCFVFSFLPPSCQGVHCNHQCPTCTLTLTCSSGKCGTYGMDCCTINDLVIGNEEQERVFASTCMHHDHKLLVSALGPCFRVGDCSMPVL